MKSNKGVTLIGLIMYVVAFVIIVGIVGTITSFFYSNTQTMNDTATSLGEFNKFNLELIREAKLKNNEVYSVLKNENGAYATVTNGTSGTRIVFTSGTSFTYVKGDDNSVYKDRIKICNNVRDCAFKVYNQDEKEIVEVYIEFDNLSRSVQYVMQDGDTEINPNTEESYTIGNEKKYIQNGLQLHYDAINNTGNGHSESTDVWRDLSENHNDGILNGGPTWEQNCLILDGTNDWVNCGEQNSDYQTIIVTFSANAINTGTYNTCIVGNWDSGGGGVMITPSSRRISADFDIYNEDRDYGYQIISSNDEAQLQKIYSVTISYDGQNETMYLNGNIINSKNAEGKIKKPINSTIYALGVNPTGSNPQQEWFTGKIYSVALYNRALTEDEVLYNYEIDKIRYGITDE